MFSLPSGLLDLFHCLWTNVRRLFRRITRKGLLAPVAKRLNPPPPPGTVHGLMLFPVTIYRGVMLRGDAERQS